MIIKKAVEQVIDSGVTPVVLDVQRVVDFSGEVLGIRTSLVIKSLQLGVLTANQYRYVARRTAQSVRLVERNVEKLCYFFEDLCQEFPTARFFTVSVYARSLLGGALYQTLSDFFAKYPLVQPEKFCLELSADILYENIEEYVKELQKLQTLGVQIALCEVAQEFCPLLRLSALPANVVFLDGYFTQSLQNEEKQAETSAVFNLITSHSGLVFGSCVEQSSIPLLEKLGADGYTLATDPTLQDKIWRLGGTINNEIN